MNTYKILTINPGSTSTKVAIFENDKQLFSSTVRHDSDELSRFDTISAQKSYRMDTILSAISASGNTINDCDAVVGRGGGLIATEGGTYAIDELLLNHAIEGANNVQHPAQLGPQLAHDIAEKLNIPAFVVNPPDTDELDYDARITGIKGVYRNVHLHALNLKETAIHHSRLTGKKYEEMNYVVCHLGGGISISAHRKGKMIDGNDIVGGEGPMTPTRSGSVSVTEILKLADSIGIGNTKKLAQKAGGFLSHFGTADAVAVEKMIADGNAAAAAVFNGMIYQIVKWIGAMAAALNGEVDAILVSGGLAYSQAIADTLKNRCSWIADVYVYPGELEMEAMAAGAVRVLNGEEQLKVYSGVKNWVELEY